MNKHVREYVFLVLGTLIISLCFNLFLSPNQIASGGLPGASLVISNVLHLEITTVLWILSTIILLGGYVFLDNGIIIKSIIGTFLIPFFVFITNDFLPLTKDPLLAAIYGGLGVGVGLGFVFRSGGNIGGFTLIAQILHKHRSIKHSSTIMIMDITVMIVASISFSPEKGLYALIGVFLTRKTMDFVKGNNKMAYIISSLKYENNINTAVLYELDLGLTKLSGSGGYSNEERIIMMTILSPSKASYLKEAIKEIDPTAFIIFCETTEVIGEGFTESWRKPSIQKAISQRLV